MLSNRPYLLRAFYQWIIDSHCNPILVIDANNPRCKIPDEYVEGGEIVFSIEPTAVRDLKMLNDSVEFKASFSGVIHVVWAPINAILAVYAEENGEGIFFDAEEDEGSDEFMPLKAIESSPNANDSLRETSDPKVKRTKPFLKLVE